MAEKKGVAARVRDAVEPIINSLGYSVWNVSYYKEAADYNLEIELDKDGGIDIDDCSRVTETINPIIDAMDPVEGAYYLVVSGAGLDRTLSCDEHLTYAMSHGYRVKAKLFTALDGKKEYSGLLSRFDQDTITITENENEIKIDRRLISRLTGWCED